VEDPFPVGKIQNLGERCASWMEIFAIPCSAVFRPISYFTIGIFQVFYEFQCGRYKRMPCIYCNFLSRARALAEKFLGRGELELYKQGRK